MADLVALAIAELVADWNPSNTDGRAPTVAKIIEYTDFNLTSGDFCGVYAGDETEEPRYIGYSGAKASYMVSFTMSTALSHAHLTRMRDEARRLVHLNRKTLLSGALWHWRRAIDVSDKRRGTFKYVCDTLVEVPSELIT